MPLTVYEAGLLDGEVLGCESNAEQIYVFLRDANQERCQLIPNTRKIERQLAEALFKRVRVSGVGEWHRRQDGYWKLVSFDVQKIQLIKECNLIQAVAEMREIKGSEWQQMENPLAVWRELRGI